MNNWELIYFDNHIIISLMKLSLLNDRVIILAMVVLIFSCTNYSLAQTSKNYSLEYFNAIIEIQTNKGYQKPLNKEEFVFILNQIGQIINKVKPILEKSYKQKFNSQQLKDNYIKYTIRAITTIDYCVDQIKIVKNNQNSIFESLHLDDCIEATRDQLDGMEFVAIADDTANYPKNLSNLHIKLIEWASIYDILHIYELARAKDNSTNDK